MSKFYKFKRIKKHFFFGKSTNKRIGVIFIKRSFTNIFLTLTDLNYKVIVCKTSGSSNISRNRRRKRVAQAVDKIMIFIHKYIKLYKISYLKLILKIKVKSHVYVLFQNLLNAGLNILSITSLRRIPHNGIRAKKKKSF